jgi:hypothetical protein
MLRWRDKGRPIDGSEKIRGGVNDSLVEIRSYVLFTRMISVSNRCRVSAVPMSLSWVGSRHTYWTQKTLRFDSLIEKRVYITSLRQGRDTHTPDTQNKTTTKCRNPSSASLRCYRESSSTKQDPCRWKSQCLCIDEITKNLSSAAKTRTTRIPRA